MFKCVKTVGELREFLSNYSDDIKLVHYSSDMERHGYFQGAYIDAEKFHEVTKKTYDRFDYVDYSYTCLASGEGENGEFEFCVSFH